MDDIEEVGMMEGVGLDIGLKQWATVNVTKTEELGWGGGNTDGWMSDWLVRMRLQSKSFCMAQQLGF